MTLRDRALARMTYPPTDSGAIAAFTAGVDAALAELADQQQEQFRSATHSDDKRDES